MQKNESKLAPSLPPDPTPEILRSRASALSTFADDLTHVQLKMPELIKLRRDIIEQLNKITQSLETAAESAVESAEAQTGAADLAKAEQDRDPVEEPVQEREAAKPSSTEAAKTAQALANAKRRNNPALAFRAKQNQASRKYMLARADVETARTKTDELMRKLQQTCH